MTDPHTWWFLEDANGRWLENIEHGAFTDDPNEAMKFPNIVLADQIRRGLRWPLWTLKATEHMWVDRTLPPPEDERVKGLVDMLEKAWLELESASEVHGCKSCAKSAAEISAALASYRGGA